MNLPMLDSRQIFSLLTLHRIIPSRGVTTPSSLRTILINGVTFNVTENLISAYQWMYQPITMAGFCDWSIRVWMYQKFVISKTSQAYCGKWSFFGMSPVDPSFSNSSKSTCNPIQNFDNWRFLTLFVRTFILWFSCLPLSWIWTASGLIQEIL